MSTFGPAWKAIAYGIGSGVSIATYHYVNKTRDQKGTPITNQYQQTRCCKQFYTMPFGGQVCIQYEEPHSSSVKNKV